MDSPWILTFMRELKGYFSKCKEDKFKNIAKQVGKTFIKVNYILSYLIYFFPIKFLAAFWKLDKQNCIRLFKINLFVYEFWFNVPHTDSFF